MAYPLKASATKTTSHYWCCVYLLAIVAVTTNVSCDDSKPIPADRAQVNAWFDSNVLPFTKRKGSIDAVLEAAESNRRVIKVRQDGSGDFKTLTEAIESIPVGNKQRVTVNIGPGTYNEKVLIPKTKPFVALRGDGANMPVLQFAGSAKKYGTFYSGTLSVMSDYFRASFIIIKNTCPHPTLEEAAAGAQAVALRLSGDKAALYGCKLYGYQDTLLDESGRHFFMSCFIQGTIDFIFGSGKSLYVNTVISVVKEEWKTVIAAQAKQEKNEDSGFSFLHCNIIGDGVKHSFLGRGWMAYSDVVFAYTTMGNAILPQGWDNSGKPPQNMLFGEFQNTGPGANRAGRVKYSATLSPGAAQRYLTLGYVQGSRWLLPVNG